MALLPSLVFFYLILDPRTRLTLLERRRLSLSLVSLLESRKACEQTSPGPLRSREYANSTGNRNPEYCHCCGNFVSDDEVKKELQVWVPWLK